MALFDIEKVPANSQEAMREWDDRYLGYIGATPAPAWSDLGELIPSSSPHVTFPISSIGLAYQETVGESKFKGMESKSFDIKSKEFDEGVEARLLDILNQSFAYRKWLESGQRLLIAEGRLRNNTLAALLEDGENQQWGTGDGIDGVNFFSATHLADFTDPDSDTWSNYNAGGLTVLSVANIQAQVTLMQGVLDENGEKLGANPTAIGVPTATYEALKFLLMQANIIDSTGVTNVSNPYVGRFKIVHMPELTDVNDWYLIDENLLRSSGLPPWISLRYMLPTNSALGLRDFDIDSDFFKNTGRIKKSSHIWYGFSLGFPHAIRKVTGA